MLCFNYYYPVEATKQTWYMYDGNVFDSNERIRSTKKFC